jgi:hypothetical protein
MHDADGWMDGQTDRHTYTFFSCMLSKEHTIVHKELSCSRPQGCGQLVSRNDRNSTAVDIQTEDKVNESELLNPYVKGMKPLY